MVSVTDPVWRYELKYPLVGASTVGLEGRVRSDPAGFREVYPPRHVNSLYLDSVELSSLADTGPGFSERSKYRLRWYGDLAGGAAPPVFEIKIKEAGVGRKERFELPSLQAGPLPVSLGGWSRSADLPEAVRRSCRSRAPVVLVRYRRRYFVSRDDRFRFTIDDDLEVHRPRGPAGYQRVRRLDPAVLELKYDVADAPYASDLLRRHPLERSNFSKYVLALDAVAGFWGTGSAFD